MFFLTPNTIVELVCFLFAIFFLYGDKSIAWKKQILFTGVIFLTETIGIFLIVCVKSKSNYWLYNIYLVIELFFVLSFFNFLFRKFNNKSTSMIIKFGVLLFSIIYIFETFYHGFSTFNEICNYVISIYYCFCCLFYFYLLIKSDEYINLLKYAPFWWVSGSLIYYFGSSATDIYFSKLIAIKDHHTRLNIMLIINIILYSCWSYSFICRKWLTKE